MNLVSILITLVLHLMICYKVKVGVYVGQFAAIQQHRARGGYFTVWNLFPTALAGVNLGSLIGSPKPYPSGH